MKKVLAVLIVIAIPIALHARIMKLWSYPELRDGADLIVIATPTAVKLMAEHVHLSNVGDIGAEMETTFEALAVLKGDPTLKTFVLHHYREREGGLLQDDGFGLVSFDPMQKKRFLMFLKKEADGRYCAVCGQTDPNMAIKEIVGVSQKAPLVSRLPVGFIGAFTDDHAAFLKTLAVPLYKARNP